MPAPKPRPPLKHLRLSDVQGMARLATDGVHGVTGIAEGVHASVLRGMGLGKADAPTQTGGLTGLIYNGVRQVNRLVAWTLDAALDRLRPWVDGPQAGSSVQREAALAALNGVLGDQLAERHNPLATTMSLRQHGEVVSPAHLEGAGRKVLLLVHGLCMNDLQWTTTTAEGQTLNHGQALAEALGYTPVYLRYNTGRHISDNGDELARCLQAWTEAWPQPIDELVVVGHSMGGLVMRSACQRAAQDGLGWLRHLKTIVFLGTPHHGAPLERAGNWLDLLLASTPYSKPFAALGQVRSAGITDLRHGLVCEADWAGRDRFQRGADPRQPLPLPAGVACYTVAATTAAKRSPLADRLLGDGLVPLRSALGEHDNPALTLAFPAERRRVMFGMGHLALLSRPEVTRQLTEWLGAEA